MKLTLFVRNQSKLTGFLNNKTQLLDSSSVVNARSMIEVSVAIISACLPTLRPLLKGISSRLNTTRHSNENSIPQYSTSHNIPLSRRTQEQQPSLNDQNNDQYPLNDIRLRNSWDIKISYLEDESHHSV